MSSTTTTFSWVPARTLKECDDILTAPGSLHEMETATIEGREYRVFKNQLPNLRAFWLAVLKLHQDKTYLVYENERYTYVEIHAQACKIADVLYTEWGVRKGDRVAILMRNYPEYVSIFWAVSLIGAVSTVLNAWAPSKVLQSCIQKTDPKVLFVDPERADRVTGLPFVVAPKRRSSLRKVVVVRSHEGKGRWPGMSNLEDVLNNYRGPSDTWSNDPQLSLEPDDDAVIFFTSGTTGTPKGVLCSQRGFIQNTWNIAYASLKSVLRRGCTLPVPAPPFQKASLLTTPLFHVMGLTSNLVVNTFSGNKVVMMRRWDKAEAVRLIIDEKVATAGGAPAIIMDLIETDLPGHILESVGSGGSPSAETMPRDIRQRFPNAMPGQGYGLSETNAVATQVIGEDFLVRPSSAGLPPPTVDVRVVNPATDKDVPTGEVGELWVRGPNIMKGYWRDPEATRKVLTKDGWFKTGDLASMDEEGFVYIRDRVKDIIIRGGENIHSIEVENALYSDSRIMDAAAVSVPDTRLGELVAAVVTTRPAFHGKVTEDEMMNVAKSLLPAHAVPVLIMIQEEAIERNPSGKIMKDLVRKRVRSEWAKKKKQRIHRAKL